MNLICNPRGDEGRLKMGSRMKDISDSGFKYSVYNASVICEPTEFRDLKKKNYLRDQYIYMTEHPEKLKDEMRKYILGYAEKRKINLPIAIAPYAACDTDPKIVDNDVLRRLSEETIVAAVEADCERVIVHPVTTGIDVSDEWEINRVFYIGLSNLADRLDSDIRILLVNKGRDINGHMVRGICAEPEESIKWVDELNALAGKKRFGFCFDIGTATLCGQNLYESIVPLGERLEAVIVRDCDGVHDVSMLPFTACVQGQQTNWLYMIRALREIGFDGDLIMDIEDTYKGFSELLRQSVMKLAYEIGEFFMWQINIEKMLKRYDRRVLFGAGNMCRAYMKNYGKEYPPLYTCDNNSSRWGEEFCGLTIEDPKKLRELPDDVAIFICNMYYNEISEQLQNMGLKNPIVFFNDEYLDTYDMDRIKLAKVPVMEKGAES